MCDRLLNSKHHPEIEDRFDKNKLILDACLKANYCTSCLQWVLFIIIADHDKNLRGFPLIFGIVLCIFKLFIMGTDSFQGRLKLENHP